jgi:hypothetical protein
MAPPTTNKTKTIVRWPDKLEGEKKKQKIRQLILETKHPTCTNGRTASGPNGLTVACPGSFSSIHPEVAVQGGCRGGAGGASRPSQFSVSKKNP